MCITGDCNDSVIYIRRARLGVTETKQTEIEFDDRTNDDSIKLGVPNSTQSTNHFCKFSTTTDYNLITLLPLITSCFLIFKSTINCAKIFLLWTIWDQFADHGRSADYQLETTESNGCKWVKNINAKQKQKQKYTTSNNIRAQQYISCVKINHYN